MVALFDSLKPWLTCTVTIKPYTGVDAYATKTYGEPFEIKAYIVGNVEVVNDMTGREVTSTSQFYFDPADYTVGPDDKVIIEGREKDILSISTWYDGNTGEADIKQVFL